MSTAKKLFLCLSSVLLFSAGWHGVTGLTLLGALVPLLIISRGYDASRRSFRRMLGWTALVFGLWNLACAWWIWYATPIGTIASTIIQILLLGTVFMLYHYASKRVSAWVACLILVSGWIAAEYLYLTGEISFPWLLAGNGFANDTWAVQWYEYTGIFGGTLWVLAANLLIYFAVVTRRRVWIAGAAALVVLPLAVSLSMFLTYEEPGGKQVKVSVLQPNIDPYVEKFTLPVDKQTDIMLELAARTPEDVDLIVLPETAIDNRIWEENMWDSPSVIRLAEFIREYRPRAEVLIGANTFRLYPGGEGKTVTARPRGDDDWYDVYNSAIAIDSTRAIPVYHKNKLVVGVEKMPYMNLLRPLESMIVDLGGTTGRLGTDEIRMVFRHTTPDGVEAAYSAPICYDSVYGEVFSSFTSNGAELMLIITNDGWWHDTPGYRQHFSFARLRAIETRRFIARSANTGISGFITPRGDVMQTLGWDKRGLLTETLTLNDKQTFYAEHGDYIARIANFIFLLGLAYYVACRIIRRVRDRRGFIR